MGTIVHTQGQGNRPGEKTFIVEREEYPLICLLDHLLYLAVYDDVLVSPKLRTVDNVFGTIVSPRKNSLQLKIKREIFDLPVFREPSRIVGRRGIRQFTVLCSSTWLRYLQRLGRSCGLGRPFTQYCARRGLINAVNNKSTLPFSLVLEAEVRRTRQGVIVGPGSDLRSPVGYRSLLPRPRGPIQRDGRFPGPPIKETAQRLARYD
ncbi:MAG: hypothetical protein LQ341_003731 [Variospora aurantia]|nr:MAG: hypothetical protein LQ341_003731 [Variospora aurantia]